MKTKKSSKLYEWQRRCLLGTEKCAKCGEMKRLTVDHIVPVSWLYQFMIFDEYISSDLEINFEILCHYCNRYKADRIDPRDPRVYEVLEYVIKLAKKEHLK